VLEGDQYFVIDLRQQRKPRCAPAMGEAMRTQSLSISPSQAYFTLTRPSCRIGQIGDHGGHHALNLCLCRCPAWTSRWLRVVGCGADAESGLVAVGIVDVGGRRDQVAATKTGATPVMVILRPAWTLGLPSHTPRLEQSRG